MPPRLFLLAAALMPACATLSATTLDLYIITGQSNSLGTIQNSVLTNGPAVGANGAEQPGTGVPFWYDNFNGYNNAADTALGASTSWGTVAAQPKGPYTYPFLGPELGFARSMQAAGATNFAIVKASRDGGGNTNWQSTATPPATGTTSGAGTAYWKIVDTVNSAVANLASLGYDDYRIAGIIYLQGESNSAGEAAAAASRLQTLVSDLSTQFAGHISPTLRTVVGENLNTASYNTYGASGWSGGSLTNAAGTTNSNLSALAAGSSDCNWVKTSDLSINNTDGLKIHADANSQLTIGQRFAYAMLNADATANNWTGSGASWNAAANWSGASAPDAGHIVTYTASSANLTQTLDGNFSVNGIAFTGNPTGNVTINSGTGANTLTLGIGGLDTTNVSGSTALTIGANLAVGTRDQTWNIVNTSATQDVSVNGALSGTATITKNGAGVLYLGAGAGNANTFSGKFAVSNGYLVLDGLGSAGGGFAVALSGFGTLALGNAFVGNTAAIGNLTGTSGTLVNTAFGSTTGTRRLSVTQTTDGVFAGTLQTSGSRILALTKTGAATLTLTGANTHSGGTVVAAGTLATGNAAALGTGAVTVNNGATLQIGDGTANTVTLGSGANLVIATGATLKFFAADSAIALQGAGSYTLGNSTIDLNGLFNAAGTYQLIAGGNAAGGTQGTLSFLNFDSTNFSAAFSGGSLVVTAVPEPSTYGLIGAGALAAVAFVRRRRKHAGIAA